MKYIHSSPILQILKFLNSCILFNIGLIDTTLGILRNLNVHFLTMWVLCCLSYNKRTRTQPLLVWKINIQMKPTWQTPCIVLFNTQDFFYRLNRPFSVTDRRSKGELWH